MKTTIMMTAMVAAITISTIALVVNFSQIEEIIAAESPQGNDMYVFAEGVYPQATFKFRDATVTYDFQVFTQVNSLFNTVGGGVARSTSPEFTLQRIVGDTPYLHKAVDQTWENSGKVSGLEYPFRQFGVTVDIVQAGQPIRTLSYGDCSITNYKITTDFDKEEPYTTSGKTGFAVIETYTFTCNGYKALAPLYDAMVKAKQNGNGKIPT